MIRRPTFVRARLALLRLVGKAGRCVRRAVGLCPHKRKGEDSKGQRRRDEHPQCGQQDSLYNRKRSKGEEARSWLAAVVAGGGSQRP